MDGWMDRRTDGRTDGQTLIYSRLFATKTLSRPDMVFENNRLGAVFYQTGGIPLKRQKMQNSLIQQPSSFVYNF